MSEPDADDPGMVYFVRAGNMIKIGWTSRSVHARIDELQTGCPSPLELLAAAEGSQAREAEYHSKFAHLRVIGEWFKDEGELQGLLDSICGGPRERRSTFFKLVEADQNALDWISYTTRHADVIVRDFIEHTEGWVETNSQWHDEQVRQVRSWARTIPIDAIRAHADRAILKMARGTRPLQAWKWLCGCCWNDVKAKNGEGAR